MKRFLALALALCAGVAQARAGDQKDDPKKAFRKAPIAAEGDAGDGSSEEPDFPPYDQQTKGFVATEGYWDLLFRAKDQGLLGVIPSGDLEKPFLLTSSISGGIPQAGWQWSDQLVAWERVGKKLALVEKNVKYRADPEKPIADAVVRTYSDRVILSTSILAESPKGLLVNLKEIFVEHARTFLQIGVDGSLAKITKRKAFPTNVELAFSAPLAGDGTILQWHYSIARLPEAGQNTYHARIADDRIGYFLTAVKDFTKGDPEEARFLRFVNRWDLRKANPELAVSPPKKPIVFYIEKTVPFRYRRWVEAGIGEWNRAFEKVGFTGAVVVRQQTDDNEFKDFDPEDARYNFLRWIVSDEGYAMGPSRVDPRTGQILDADIVFDDAMVEYYAGEYERLLKEGPGLYKGAGPAHGGAHDGALDPGAQAFAERLSKALEPFGVQLDPERALTAMAAMTDGTRAVPAFAKSKDELAARFAAHPPVGACKIGKGVAHEMAMFVAKRLLFEEGDATRAKNVPEEFLGEVIKETVMHEVGHTLGLRHNFKASSWRTLEEINSEERPGDLAASVMDYNPINLAPEGRPQGHYQNVTIGPYDYWAIEYGYKPAPEGKDLEPAELAAIATRTNEPGHAYGTDEDLGSRDPLCLQWDMGKNPLDFCRSRIDFAKKLRDKLFSRAVKQGESWEKLRRGFEMVLFEQARAGQYAARLVGSQEIRRNHKGDPGEKPPFELLPVEQQRAALAFVAEQVFDDAAFKLSPEMLTHLAAGRWSHWGSSDDGAAVVYPVHERVLQMQRFALDTLLSDGVLERLRDAQAKTQPGEDVLTIPELFQTLEKAIFSELDQGRVAAPTARSPQISTFRQNLQDYYVKRLMGLALAQQTPGVIVPNPAAKKIAAARLKALQEKCAGALAGGRVIFDEDSRAHLEAIAKRAQAVDAASYVHIASGCALSPVEAAPVGVLPLVAGLVLLVGLRIRKRSA